MRLSKQTKYCAIGYNNISCRGMLVASPARKFTFSRKANIMSNYTPEQLALPLFNEKNCLNCGKVFTDRPSHLDRKNYCCKSCMAEHYKVRMSGRQNPNFRNIQQLTCQQCNASYASYNKKRRFCSRECYYASNRKTNQIKAKPVIKAKPAAKLKFVRLNLLQKAFYYRECVECSNNFVCKSPSAKRCKACMLIYFESLKKKRTCKNCGSEFWREPNNNRVTCSDDCSAEWKSKRQMGENSHFWKGGKTKETLILRGLFTYDSWRKSVYERDDYTCQLCQQRGGRLTAHHIKLFSKHEDLRLHVGNGITLCWGCHTSIRHKEEQYEECFFSITGGV